MLSDPDFFPSRSCLFTFVISSIVKSPSSICKSCSLQGLLQRCSGTFQVGYESDCTISLFYPSLTTCICVFNLRYHLIQIFFLYFIVNLLQFLLPCSAVVVALRSLRYIIALKCLLNFSNRASVANFLLLSSTAASAFDCMNFPYCVVTSISSL